MQLFAPNGLPIIGIVEIIPQCCAYISNPSKESDGVLSFDYEGETDVNWNGQEPAVNASGARLFFDEDRNIWPENVLELREASDNV